MDTGFCSDPSTKRSKKQDTQRHCSAQWVMCGENGAKQKDCCYVMTTMCGTNVEGLHQKVGEICGKCWITTNESHPNCSSSDAWMELET